MNLTNSQRVLKLIGNLLSNPDLISPYIQHNIVKKKLPIELELPWWSYKAIEYVDTIVDGKKIFEYGTGGSTVRFAKKAKSIVAVEDDKVWADMVTKILQEKKINNVKVKFLSFNFQNPVDFETSNYIQAVDDDIYDIIIIDGQDYSYRERIKCFQHIEPRMQPGQFIILDDFWRYEELLSSNKAEEVKIFESVGPCRFGVTSTAVFVY